MYRVGSFLADDLMSDLICADYPMLLVLSRFGIPLGFGDKSIGEVCAMNGIDTDTFLAVVNLLATDEDETPDIKNSGDISVPAIVSYLRNSHSYFLGFRLPLIKRKLIEAMDYSEGNEIAQVIIRYFDEYVAEVRKHMLYEEETVFPYVEALLEGRSAGNGYNIGIFGKQHDRVESKLSELKNIIIKYYPAKSSNELNSALFDIFACADDLASHNRIEDCLFVPVIRDMELNANIG